MPTILSTEDLLVLAVLIPVLIAVFTYLVLTTPDTRPGKD